MKLMKVQFFFIRPTSKVRSLRCTQNIIYKSLFVNMWQRMTDKRQMMPIPILI